MIAAQSLAGVQRADSTSGTDALHPAIRRLHFGTESFSGMGTFAMRRGRRALSRIVAAVLRFPREGRHVPLELHIQCNGRRQVWQRSFDGRRVDATFSIDRHRAVERFGPLELLYAVRVQRGSLRLVCFGAAVRAGAVALRLPRWLAPRVRSRTWFDRSDGCVRVSVVVMAPVAGLLLAYRGWVMEV
jgi:hypothetical protein